MKAFISFVGLLVLSVATHAQGYQHQHCSTDAGTPPVLQNMIHDAHLAYQDCGNLTAAEGNDDEAVGHPQSCLATYGSIQWSSVECHGWDGCEAKSLVYCAGSYVVAQVNCPNNQGGGPGVGGALPQASASRFGVACSYHDALGNLVTKKCSCSNSTGCS